MWQTSFPEYVGRRRGDLTQVRFSPLSAAEANRWLVRRSDTRVSAPTSIAELLAISEGREIAPRQSSNGPAIGFGAAIENGFDHR